jgi:hypothetical protein
VLEVVREVHGGHAALAQLPLDPVPVGEGGGQTLESAQVITPCPSLSHPLFELLEPVERHHQIGMLVRRLEHHKAAPVRLDVIVGVVLLPRYRPLNRTFGPLAAKEGEVCWCAGFIAVRLDWSSQPFRWA